jgi:protease IV
MGQSRCAGVPNAGRWLRTLGATWPATLPRARLPFPVGYATVRAILRAVSNLLRVLLAPLWLLGRVLGRPKGPWIELHLTPRVHELRSALPMWRRFLPPGSQPRATALQDLREFATLVAEDPSVVGVLVHVPHLQVGWAACAGLRGVISSLRAAGKDVVCYLPQGASSRELYVALAANRIWLAPTASLGPLGLASRPLYLKQLLERVGVVVQVQATGEYKSAAEPLLREGMSDASREQNTALLGALHAALRDAMCAHRELDATRADAALGRGLLTARGAHEAGIVERLVYEDELRGGLGLNEPKAAFVPTGAYLRFQRARWLVPMRAEPYIAVVAVRGTIVADAPPLGRSAAVQSTIVAALRKAAVDPQARAVVLDIQSPGGSALASDMIHREVLKLREHKPVIACMGDVAASGGYYIAAAADRIVAQPVTITGSIGVISMKVAIDGLLSRLGIRSDGVHTTPHADMFSALRQLDEAEERLMADHARELYARFLEVVAQGRGKSVDEVDAMARGRVWSGQDAHARGLVDILGGFDAAIAEARARAKGVSATQREALAPRLITPAADEQPAPIPPVPAALAWLEASVPDEVVQALSSLWTERCLYLAPSVLE